MLVTAGVILIFLGIFLKLAFVIASIPVPVTGGAAIIMFSTIAFAGIKVLKKTDLNVSCGFLVPVFQYVPD